MARKQPWALALAVGINKTAFPGYAADFSEEYGCISTSAGMPKPE